MTLQALSSQSVVGVPHSLSGKEFLLVQVHRSSLKHEVPCEHRIAGVFCSFAVTCGDWSAGSFQFLVEEMSVRTALPSRMIRRCIRIAERVICILDELYSFSGKETVLIVRCKC